MPGADFIERERRKPFAEWNDGTVRGRNSAHKPEVKDPKMPNDIDDIDCDKHYLPGLRHNALTGALAVSQFDVLLQERITIPVATGSEWVVDLLTRRRGFGRTGDGIFDFHMTPVGTTPPAQPSEDHKPAVGQVMFSQQYGLCEMITNSTITRSAVLSFWEDCKAQPEAFRGLLPVVRFGEPVEVKMGKNNVRIFYAPNFSIVGWVERDTIAAFRGRPVTVPSPSPSPEKLSYASATPQLAPPPKRPARTSAPVRATTREIGGGLLEDDAIPFAACWQ